MGGQVKAEGAQGTWTDLPRYVNPSRVTSKMLVNVVFLQKLGDLRKLFNIDVQSKMLDL